ncbi:ATP-dependent helicase/nuclease subunit A [Frankliniella fusca]|uniref:ATP-dependent helicase/nuclease subunit A n=1 Tax=Frankliniella fusca TaxID=407009 RepID=A0AAE1LV99_9NEOP|nr:ATP-dependent helicase/nuclease subunit A [Frankliniella fusca]
MKMLQCVNLDIATDHIMACFVLHNFMILNGEVLMDLEDAWNVPDDQLQQLMEGRATSAFKWINSGCSEEGR